jgi:hypothetical protein
LGKSTDQRRNNAAIGPMRKGSMLETNEIQVVKDQKIMNRQQKVLPQACFSTAC